MANIPPSPDYGKPKHLAPFDRDGFVERLRESMKHRRVTQQTLAKAVGISPRCMSLYCVGQRVPGAETLNAIGLMLQISTDYLLRGDLPLESDLNPSRIMDIIQLLSSKDRETLLTLALMLFRGSDTQRQLIYAFVAIDKLQVSETFPRRNSYRKTQADKHIHPRADKKTPK